VITSLGIDPGQSRDYSAIASVTDDRNVWTLSARERLPLGMPYTEVARRIAKLTSSAGPQYVMVDAGGPGRPVIDLLRVLRTGAPAPTPVSIIGNGRVKRNLSGSWSIPKTTFMERMASAMEQGKLKIACDRPMADALIEEMRAFVRSITQHGNVTVEAKRTHDDLILAVALAMWARAEHSLTRGSIEAA
jgi:hypothetical protein